MLGFKRNNSGADRDAIAREIAERCASSTLSQVSHVADDMSVSQLRGYARAIAWPQVWAEAQQAEADGRLPKSQTHELADRALEQAVHLVTSAYRTVPIIAMPAPHIGRRAAA